MQIFFVFFLFVHKKKQKKPPTQTLSGGIEYAFLQTAGLLFFQILGEDRHSAVLRADESGYSDGFLMRFADGFAEE